ncbi:MAG: S8 family serine peptidase [Armatimonadota bacterium]|nr:S8 family serine peptidase [Armatimonadota bacterium]
MKKLIAIAASAIPLACSAAEVIVELAPGADPQEVGASHGLALLDVTNGGPFAMYLVPKGTNPEELELTLEADPRVVWAEENDDLSMPEHSGGGKATVIGAVGDPNQFYQLNAGFLSQVGWIPPASARALRPINVAVLDTGLSPRHPFLLRKVVAWSNFVEVGTPPYDLPRGHFTNGNAVPDEAAGHGTMVAGVIAQMAPHAGLIPVRVADSDGVTSSWRIIEGLVFSVNAGADVINISLGSIERVTALSDVMDWVEVRDVVTVAAAGNNAQETDFFPATYSEVISVCAIDHQDRKAVFSNWEGSVDMSAPGTGIRSYYWDGNMAVWSGTSFSSPMVAAGIAVGLEYARRNYTVDEIQDLLESTGTNIDNLNPQYEDDIGVKLHIRRFVQAIRAG